MRVVKADAKGRITGFVPGEEYLSVSEGGGRTTVSPVREEARHVGDVSVDELFGTMGLSPDHIPAGQDFSIRELPDSLSDGSHIYGFYMERFVLNSKGERVIHDEDGFVRENIVVRLRIG